MADDTDGPNLNTDSGPQGFGGGSSTQQPAIPDQPASGQSLEQDISNNVNSPDTPFNAFRNTYNTNARIPAGGGAQALIPKIMNYLTGANAMPKQDWEQLNQQVDPNGTMDQNERTMRAVDAAQQQSPEAGAAAIQAARKHYDVYRAGAAKALSEGNMPLALQQTNQAFDYVPDGTKASFTADKNGVVTATVHDMNGQAQNFTMNPNQLHRLLQGQEGMFDHVVDQGAHGVVGLLSQAGNDLTSSAQKPSPTVGQVQRGDELPSPARTIKDAAGNTYNVPEGGKVVTDSEGRQHILGPGQEYSQMTGNAYTNPKGQVVNHTGNGGEEEPITVMRGGHPELWGNAKGGEGNTPEDVTTAREMFPNDVARQAAYLQGERNQRAGFTNKVEVAKNTRLYGSQAAAQGRVGAAQVAGQSRENVAAGQNQSRENVAQTNAGAKRYAADMTAAWERYKTDNPNQQETGMMQSEMKLLGSYLHENPTASKADIDQFMTDRFGRINWAKAQRNLAPHMPDVNQGETPMTTSQTSSGATGKQTQPEIRTDGKGNFYQLGPDGRPVLVQPPAGT